MKKLAYVAFGFCLVGFSYWYLSAQKNELDTTVDTPDIVERAEDSNSDLESSAIASQTKTTIASTNNKKTVQMYPRLQERLDVMSERRPGVSFDPAEVDAAMNRQAAWTPKNETPKDLPLTPEELSDGRKFFELDTMKIETLVPGDQVTIAIEENNKTYQMTIDAVENHDYETVSWRGHLDIGDGQSYPVSFTRGKQLTVGGISTPEGEFVLQAHGNTGWVAPSGLLFSRHVDPLIPPEEAVNHGG
jgi:hypothetical protein